MNGRSSQRGYLIYALLAAATIVVYWQVYGFGFVAIDDFVYASENPWVLRGISADSIHWAFTTTTAANWHPLTWLSLMLDAQVAGWLVPNFARSPSAGIFHITNAVLHVLSTCVLFASLVLMTGERWKSAFVAALFALHPLHVESVAWVSERKDVLSGLFWMLTMLAYAKYAKKPRALSYAAMLVLFALGLMSKPMLVSLPIVLLLMDYWPLGRLAFARRSRPRRRSEDGRDEARMLLVEKIPLFALAAASCAVTLWAQSKGGAVVASELVPVGQRLANAATSTASYIGKFVSPINLAAFYPHPGPTLPVWQVVASTAVIAGGCAIAIVSARRCRAVTIGWFWYIITLIPVIGIVQVGPQGMADRYTYVPLIGLFLGVTWGASHLLDLTQAKLQGRLSAKIVRKGVALAVLVGLAVTSYFQVGYWRDTISLMKHAVAVTTDNYYAHIILGAALHKAGRNDEAFEHSVEAVRLRPNYSRAHYTLARTMAAKNLVSGAVEHYRIALKTDPGNADIHNDLGCALGRLGDFEGATKHFEEALRLNPKHLSAQQNLNKIQKARSPQKSKK